MSKLRAFLVLMRPPNLLTALADILAGFAASAALHHHVGIEVFDFVKHDLPWLQLFQAGMASMLLYAGGVVFNDVFDAELDSRERPERPIPSGQVSETQAAIFGGLLMMAAVTLAFLVNMYSGFIALIIVTLVITYDTISKRSAFFGPLNMGLCRGANLLLGISLFPQNLTSLGFLAIVPIIYITAITLVSRGEVHGNSRKTFNFALFLYILTAIMILSVGILEEFSLWQSAVFLSLLLVMVLPPLIKARKGTDPALIGNAVKSGVLGIILLDAALAAGFAGWFFGLLLLILLPFSILAAKSFAVT